MKQLDFRRLWNTRRVENILRRMMGLQSFPEDWMAPGFRLVPEDGDLRRMEILSTHEKQQDLDQEKAEGWRRILASELARLPWKLERGAQATYHQAVDPLRRKRALQQISNSRWITFESPYVLEIGASNEVEGTLMAPGCPGISTTISSLGYLEASARQEWNKGSVLDLVQHAWPDLHLVVPEKVLTPENVLLALQHWYLETYAWDDQHWSHCENRLPSFNLDLEWQEWRDYWRQGLDDNELAMSDLEYRQDRSKKINLYARDNRAKRKKLYQRFGLK